MADVATTRPDDASSDDVRHDDIEFNPKLEPKKAKAWLNRLDESETAFEKWNSHCDNIDKLYGNLERLANKARDKQFQMFWANAEVIKPTIYAKAPQPVVITKFKDRRPVYQAAAELLERTCTVSFDLAKIDDLMKLCRDDVALISRGVAWCRYESGRNSGSYYDSERVCIDFKHRRDFLHSISRCWYEVTWVAAASYLTREEARERFHQYSGDEYQDAEYTVDRDAKEVGGADNRERGKFWEIWDKQNRRVVWVAKGCENILDEDDPHLDLQDFFPCPQPAYGTLQRGSLVPVPDVLQYKDQLDELNLLTAKIHALSDALEAKGFYPAGGAEIGDAVETALATHTPGRVLVPISNWAAFGGSSEVIIWLPMAEIASTIQTLISTRQQIIQDIYQIMGLSDIMRGATDPNETLGAQELKSQFGSTRTRDKQIELVRLARDLVVLVSDIVLDKFSDQTIIYMTQTQLPTQKMQRDQVTQLMGQLQQQQQQLAQAQQMMQQQPPPPPGQPGAPPQQNDQIGQQLAQAQQTIQDGAQAIKDLMNKPTFEQVMTFLRDERARSFVLDIETDSTILIDENTEKQRRGEFIGMLAQLLPQLAQMMSAEPMTASFCGEMLKFAVAPYRASRAMDGAIDNLVMLMEQKANQPRGDDPTTAQNKTAIQIEQMKDQRERDKNQADAALKQKELDQKDRHEQDKLNAHVEIEHAKLAANQQDAAANAQEQNIKIMGEREKQQTTRIQSFAKQQESAAKVQAAERMQNLKENDFQQRAAERRATQQMRLTQPQAPPRGLV